MNMNIPNDIQFTSRGMRKLAQWFEEHKYEDEHAVEFETEIDLIIEAVINLRNAMSDANHEKYKDVNVVDIINNVRIANGLDGDIGYDSETHTLTVKTGQYDKLDKEQQDMIKNRNK